MQHNTNALAWFSEGWKCDPKFTATKSFANSGTEFALKIRTRIDSAEECTFRFRWLGYN